MQNNVSSERLHFARIYPVSHSKNKLKCKKILEIFHKMEISEEKEFNSTHRYHSLMFEFYKRMINSVIWNPCNSYGFKVQYTVFYLL